MCFAVPMDLSEHLRKSISEVLFGHCAYCKDVHRGPYGQDVAWLGRHCASPYKQASVFFEVFLSPYGQTRTDFLSRPGVVEWSSSCAFGDHRSFGEDFGNFSCPNSMGQVVSWIVRVCGRGCL